MLTSLNVSHAHSITGSSSMRLLATRQSRPGKQQLQLWLTLLLLLPAMMPTEGLIGAHLGKPQLLARTGCQKASPLARARLATRTGWLMRGAAMTLKGFAGGALPSRVAQVR